ncbi:hypothetical protein [Lewinella sp. IMCC34183]|uniref:hypothetical protein n=1 Tax=Lewinella sp. IMCC34183 TaxID=2248762 RepID=UPI000E282B58|nr:hypothetical protein [Lewinella sp. IMCC34183]
MDNYTEFDILNIIKADFRLRSEVDPIVNGDDAINRDITINDWLEICDLLPVEHQRDVYNEWFEINISEEEWKQRLNPGNIKKIKDLCKLLSEKSPRKHINAIRLFGSDCKEAALFRAIKYKNRNVTLDTPFSDPIMDDNWDLFQTCQLLKPGFKMNFEIQISRRFDIIVWFIPLVLIVLALVVYYYSMIASFTFIVLFALHLKTIRSFPNIYMLREKKYDSFKINGCSNLKEFIRKEGDTLLHDRLQNH